MGTTRHMYMGICLFIKVENMDKWDLSELVDEDFLFLNNDDDDGIITDGDNDIIIGIPNIEGDFDFNIEEQNAGYQLFEIEKLDFAEKENNFKQEFEEDIEKLRNAGCDIEIKRVIFGYYM